MKSTKLVGQILILFLSSAAFSSVNAQDAQSIVNELKVEQTRLTQRIQEL